ncbi:hypothetical protein C7S16_6353 [Burkholderia thailandensis]|uniref:Uncharacterized protein n=1 Tax=Burkholderia thailandensis TaxID=57975 RepID=A0AAW9CTH2_BURTH|nr:hypothetical protein [Burkholderia thailandensis]
MRGNRTGGCAHADRGSCAPPFRHRSARPGIARRRSRHALAPVIGPPIFTLTTVTIWRRAVDKQGVS